VCTRFLYPRIDIDIPHPNTYFFFLLDCLFNLINTSQRGILKQEQVAINKFRSNRREAVAKLKKEDIDYKRLDVLTQFITPTGKIEAARRTGANRKQQAQVVRAIKRARYLALMPYTRDDAR